MTKFTTPLFFSVPFLAGTFLLALVLGDGLLNINPNSAFAEAEVLVTCMPEFGCVVEDLLPRTTIDVLPESESIDVSANVGNTEIDNPDRTPTIRTGTRVDDAVENINAIVVVPDEIGPIVDPENATGVRIENNDSSSIVIEIEPTGPIVDPAPEDSGKGILKELSDKNMTAEYTETFIPKVPNTGRPQ